MMQANITNVTEVMDEVMDATSQAPSENLSSAVPPAAGKGKVETAMSDVDIMRTVMMVIGILGTLDNGFVLFVIVKFKTLRNKLPNMLILNQSIADLAVALVIIGDSVAKFVTGYDVRSKGLAGDLYCKLWLSSALQWCLLLTSTYNLMAITIERYMMVVHPIVYKTSFTRRRALHMALAVWAIGFGYELIPGVASSGVRGGVCEDYAHFPSHAWQKAFGLTTITVSFFVPMIVHPTLYGHMVVVLRRRSAMPHLAQNAQQHSMSKAQRNLLKTMAIVTICFFLCWSWNQLTFFFYNLGVEYDTSTPFHLFTISAVGFNCCVNPVVYCLTYDEFRRAVRTLLRVGTQVEPSEST